MLELFSRVASQPRQCWCSRLDLSLLWGLSWASWDDLAVSLSSPHQMSGGTTPAPSHTPTEDIAKCPQGATAALVENHCSREKQFGEIPNMEYWPSRDQCHSKKGRGRVGSHNNWGPDLTKKMKGSHSGGGNLTSWPSMSLCSPWHSWIYSRIILRVTLGWQRTASGM